MFRDFTYIDDVCDAITNLINENQIKNEYKFSNNKVPWRIFNIGNKNSINLMDFIKVIEDYLNVKANKVFLEIQPGDIKDTYADIDKLERYTAYEPK